jgi:hypothetical protein
MANQNNRTSMNKLFMSMVRIFKAADSEALADLSDAIDIGGPKDTGMWPGNGARMRNVNTGPAESASGSGAEKMVTDYSKDTSQEGLAAAYQQFAEALADQGKRVESVEKAVSAIAGLLSTAIKGERFPEDESEEKGKEDGETEEDESASSKSALPTMNVPALMRALSGASRDSGKTGLVTPPNMAVIKAGGNKLQELLYNDDGRRFPMHARMELQSIQHALANNDGGQMRGQHLANVMGRASPEAKLALSMAGII